MQANTSDDLRFARRVVQVREQFGATECARLLGVKPATIHRWAKSGRAPDRLRCQVEDLHLIGDLFADRGTPEVALRWLHGMNPTLGYEKPADEIARGRWVLVISAARDYVSKG